MTPLRLRMLQDMRIRNFTQNTQRSYLEQVSRFARHFGRSPEELGPDDVRAYQIHLLEVRKLSAGSRGIAASALRFLYKVTLKRELGRGIYSATQTASPTSGDSVAGGGGLFPQRCG
jgi:integrase/recombinase XerD